jgi:hypothetical protein
MSSALMPADIHIMPAITMIEFAFRFPTLGFIF